MLAAAVKLGSAIDRALVIKDTPDSELLRLTAAAVNLLLLESIEREATRATPIEKRDSGG